jgi:hypothetical protein
MARYDPILLPPPIVISEEKTFTNKGDAKQPYKLAFNVVGDELLGLRIQDKSDEILDEFGDNKKPIAGGNAPPIIIGKTVAYLIARLVLTEAKHSEEPHEDWEPYSVRQWAILAQRDAETFGEIQNFWTEIRKKALQDKEEGDESGNVLAAPEEDS